MKETSVADKILASIVNVAIVFPFFFVVVYFMPNIQNRKILFIILFLIYNVFIVFMNRGRCIGMVLTGLHWKENYSYKNHIIYIILYTISFATLFFPIYFVLDLFLFNLFFIQLPFVLLKSTTLHGYLSGNMTTIKK